MIKSATKFFISFVLFLLCGYSLFYSQVAATIPDTLSFDQSEHATVIHDYPVNCSVLSPNTSDAGKEKVSIERSVVENEEEDEDESTHKIYTVTGSLFTVLYNSQSFTQLFQNIQKSAYLNKLDYSNIPTKKYILIEVFRI